MSRVKFAFFGTAPLARIVLDELEAAGFTPALVIASNDSFNARTKEVVFPEEKQWAHARYVPVIQPRTVDDELMAVLRHDQWDVFIVASYGKILPRALLDIPARGTLNIHPSLLPRLRGPSPMRSALLNDEKETGVSIMLLDDKMDHGPLLAQKKVHVAPWPPRGKELDELLAKEGGRLLATILPEWLSGGISPREQNHDIATYCTHFSKEDGLLDLRADGYKNLLKIRAYEGWPGTYAFFERNGKDVRAKITDAHLEGEKLVIDTVVPDGKKEMPFSDFLRSGAKIK